MQVNTSTNTSYVSTVDQTPQTQKSEKSSEVKFDIATLENKNPIEITYTEYKSLDEEDIEQLFPKESMPKENEKAMALHKKVNISDDEILNQVLFEKELEAKDSEVAKSTLGMIDFLDDNWAMLSSFESYEKADQYMKENNIPFSKEGFVQAQQKIEKTIEYDYDKKMTAEELFEVFDHNKLGYEANIEFYNYTANSEEYQSYQEKIAYRESIIIAYEEKQNERNAILQAYTRNNKQTLIFE